MADGHSISLTTPEFYRLAMNQAPMNGATNGDGSWNHKKTGLRPWVQSEMLAQHGRRPSSIQMDLSAVTMMTAISIVIFPMLLKH